LYSSLELFSDYFAGTRLRNTLKLFFAKKQQQQQKNTPAKLSGRAK
jgi:hypothetical protein